MFAAFFLALSATALAGFLVFSGAPSPCVDRAIDPAPESDQALQANWLALLQGVAGGETVTLSITEEQASVLGEGYLRGRDVPAEDVRVHFCPDGTTEVTGTLKLLGLKSDVRARGYLDTTGTQPRVEIESVDAGRFPSSLSRHLLNTVMDEERVLTLPLAVNINELEVTNGEAIVVVTP